MAKDAAGLMLHCLELDQEEIPEPTPLNKITIGSNQRVVLIEVRMPMIRRAVESASVKKTLTIPAWLNRLAEKHGVNFSQVLKMPCESSLGRIRQAYIGQAGHALSRYTPNSCTFLYFTP